MKNSKLSTNLILLSSAFLLITAGHFINKNNLKPTIFLTKQQSTMNLDENFWNYFHLGNKRLLSSLLWITTILESDHDHYKGKDLNSWMYLRFKSMSILEPKFINTYTFGGTYLSIIKDDLDGASDIFQIGLKEYPKNNDLLKNAFYHFYYEVQNLNQSKAIIEQLVNNNAQNQYMISALGRIQSLEGNLEDAYSFILENYNSLKESNPFIAEKFYSFLYAIKAEMDLKCLNENKSDCNQYDLKGNKYIKDQTGNYKAKEEWLPFRPKNKKGR